MKRIRIIALGLALCSALSACSRFVPSSYTRVSAHSQTKSEQVDTNVVSVGDYAGLRRAIRDFVRGGVEHGVIRVQQYAGTRWKKTWRRRLTPLRARTQRALTRWIT